MDKMQGMIPLSTSPDIKMMQSIDKWSKSESTWKREGQTRLVSLVAGAPIAMVGALYNTIVLLIKLPVTTFRVLTGWIPTKAGHFRDDMPADTSVVHMIWHAYKVVMCTVDIVLVPVMGLIHPKANNWIHVKLGVCFVVESRIIPNHKIPKPPPPPQKTVNKERIEKKRNDRGFCDVNGERVRLCDFEADELKKRRLLLRGSAIDSDTDSDEEVGLPLGPDDEQDLTERVWGFEVSDKELQEQGKKLKDAKARKLGPKKPTAQDKQRQEQQVRMQQQDAAIDQFLTTMKKRYGIITDTTGKNND